MIKIRINELARELEVKPHKILDLLPELGVTEKKTHSSSIDEDVAVLVKRHFGFDSPTPRPSAGGHEAAIAEGEEVTTELTAEREKATAVAELTHAPVAAAAPDSVMAEQAAAEAPKETPPAAPAFGPVRPPIMPLRPPLAGALAPPAPPAVPVAREAEAPAPKIPVQPPPAPPQRTIVVPGKAVPPPRPGQILTGPRQPLPAGLERPAVRTEPHRPEGSRPEAPRATAPAVTPAAPTVPGIPRPPAQPTRPAQTIAPGTPMRPPQMPGGQIPGAPRPQQPGPGAPRPQQPQATPSAPGPGAPRPPQQRPATLAGQPTARPVVPPRPDLVARLAQQQTKATPGQPPPRPPMPGKPAPSPTPGQPIYRGPIRPGQPIVRPGGPGQPGGGPGARTGDRGGARPQRPMHPTTPLRIEPQPVPVTDTQRRDARKPTRPGDRRREEEEKTLRYPSRRSEPEPPPPIDREITISEGITVKELADKLGVKANLVIKKLVERKIFATINQTLNVKLAEELSREFGAQTNQVSYEEEATWDIEMKEEVTDLVKRPPVITIMGHVDHGKTSLLDAIRSANVAAGEAGGITQHIGAYHVERDGRKIVFIDTPGHEAFTRMRARGAKVTDLVVLVVAADDGVMPQTIEAIDHAKAAKVPIIVAINKIDKGDAQPERIKQQLSERGLLAEDWGGDVVMVPLSAKTKINIDLLLEMILLVSDLQNLKANPGRPAVGTVLEAQLDRGRGPVATVLVRNGTLRTGDYFICGAVFGKVRAMHDDRGTNIKEAGPSMPVEVLGLESLPEVGDTFQVTTDTAKAKQIVLYREAKTREAAMAKGSRMNLDMLHLSLKEGETKELNIILKTDVGGTAEVLSDTLQKLSTDKVKVRVLHSGVGAITETDVLLASASNGIIVGFNVRPERNAASVAEQEKVDIRLHTIIYELTDEIKKAMTGLLAPVFKEQYKGRALVREVFKISKVGTIAGCSVQDGTITRDSQVRLLRDNIVIYTGKIGSLRRFKDDVSEVKNGFECGIGIQNFGDIKPDDVIEAFIMERVAGVL